ncbi:hypothetical protein R3P38DRAFT_3172083 [Favolaschia claudopus]|uniref:Uncharacterized protein n=1 Tax=Favolaschia claudopus TaxID=2862362 RepID=A0AAW0DK55_9AGAR
MVRKHLPCCYNRRSSSSSRHNDSTSAKCDSPPRSTSHLPPLSAYTETSGYSGLQCSMPAPCAAFVVAGFVAVVRLGVYCRSRSVKQIGQPVRFEAQLCGAGWSSTPTDAALSIQCGTVSPYSCYQFFQKQRSDGRPASSTRGFQFHLPHPIGRSRVLVLNRPNSCSLFALTSEP